MPHISIRSQTTYNPKKAARSNAEVEDASVSSYRKRMPSPARSFKKEPEACRVKEEHTDDVLLRIQDRYRKLTKRAPNLFPNRESVQYLPNWNFFYF